MTGKDAAAWLKDLIKDVKMPQHEEALYMGIKALEQEPKEIYAKGYTDGQRAFAEHIKLCKEEQEPKTETKIIGRDTDGNWHDFSFISEQEPKTGKWHHYEGMIRCTKCNMEFYDDIMEYCGEDVPRYCPNCGAKMESEGCYESNIHRM